jgi:hypothetical protein
MCECISGNTRDFAVVCRWLADWYAVSSADNCRREIAEGYRRIGLVSRLIRTTKVATFCSKGILFNMLNKNLKKLFNALNIKW